MRKKSIVCILPILFFALQSWAQGNGKVTGMVTDNKANPLASVTVSLLRSADSSLVKTELSDKAGKFDVDVLKDGDYLLGFSVSGYEKMYSDKFSISEGRLKEIPVITMSPVVTKLQGVTVTSRKPMIEVKADKTVFNVEASINATGSNALELLQKSPGVLVDNNDNITMKGKTGVRVYVDGKMMQLSSADLAAYLKSITSNDIEAIEMISNPSAKYDASGNAGIINIRLKKNKKFGTNGSTSIGLVQGVTPKGNASVNLNYRNKKVNLFSNIGGNIGQNQNQLEFERIQKDTLYDQKTSMYTDGRSLNIKAGADFFLSKNHTLGLMSNANINSNTWYSSGVTDIYDNKTGVFNKKLLALNTIPGTRTNLNNNLNYRYADTSGREINVDIDYGLFRGTGRSFQPNNYFGNNNQFLYSVVNRNNTPTDIDIFTAKVDAEQRLGKGKLGYGAKTSIVTTKNSFEFFNDDANGNPIKILDRSNSFTYKENVYAAYLNYQRQLNAKWSMQAGLRAEQTNSKGILKRDDGLIQADNTVEREYLDFFPSAALSWNASAKHSFNLTYSRRIDRPTYQDLNPFENKLDELTYQKGNAFLQPQYTDNVELTHTFLGMINTAVGYSFVRDFATQATDTINNATFIQQKNLGRQQIISASISSPLPIKKWWNGFVNVWYNYQMYDGKIGENDVHVNIPSYGAYMQHSFSLGKDYTAEVSGWFNGPSIWGGTWRTKSQGAMDLGLQKQLFNRKATIKVSATDIFFTAPWTATNDFGGLFIKGGGNWESRTVRVNFNWRFGSNQIKASRQRQTGLDAESKRIKG